MLTGTIPTHLGLLKGLEYLDLSFNNLKGTIPTELGLLENLRYLALGGNKLTGKTPIQVCNLQCLETKSLIELGCEPRPGNDSCSTLDEGEIMNENNFEVDHDGSEDGYDESQDGYENSGDGYEKSGDDYDKSGDGYDNFVDDMGYLEDDNYMNDESDGNHLRGSIVSRDEFDDKDEDDV